jgi:phenylacetate-CoA ligase
MGEAEKGGLDDPGGSWRSCQEARLREQVAYARRRSPFYRECLAGIDPERLTLATLRDLPCTTKADFDGHNEAFRAVPPEWVVEIVETSGTSGRPACMIYTDRDLQRLAENERQAMGLAGVTVADTALLTCTLDRSFIAGLAYWLGLRALGAAVIRGGQAPLSCHVDGLRRHRPTVLVGVPTFLRRLAGAVREVGIDPAALGVRTLVCIGEPLRDATFAPTPLCRELTVAWGAAVHSTYASTECVTAFCECDVRQGGHLLPDLAVAEILDDAGRPVAPGDVGELTLTPLGVEGMPLIRYRTGDITFLADEPCPCGRSTPRLGPILGRRHQMIKLHGTTLYPAAINAVLDGIPGIEEYQVTVSAEADLADRVSVAVALRGPATVAAVEAALQAALRVRVPVEAVPAEELRPLVFPPGLRKARRFADARGAGGAPRQ